MNNPPSQIAPSSDAPDDSRSMFNQSWGSGSEASNEDSDECEVDSPVDESCVDEAYWEEDTAADAWLARFPGGSSILYPQLFVVKPHRGKVLTPPRYLNNHSLLHLPSEIRNRIYKHYFDSDEEDNHPEERHALFHDCKGMEMQRIHLSSENPELKFWLSTALLQTSRQLRFEAMVIFFSNRVITVEWFPVLPRFVEFLGTKGSAMVRYLDIWDTLNLQGEDNASYREIISSIMGFSGLQHLRIVVSWGMRSSGLWSARTRSWFNQNEWENQNEWKQNGILTKQAIPKMRSEDVERHWPEYGVLKDLKAQKFTLAAETWDNRCLEFDRSHGAYPEICQSMQSNAARTQLAPSSANLASSSISPQVLEAFEAIEIQPRPSALTPNTESDDEDSDSPTWQETDTLANKTIPLYNFLREFFHNNIRFWPVRVGEMSADNFVTFPTSRKSTGSIMQDCPFCYLIVQHCGYHAMPDQPPFTPTPLENDEEVDTKTLQTRFENLSYVGMQNVCRHVVRGMEDAHVTEFEKIVAIFEYTGWPEASNREVLTRLDTAVEAGWTGKRVDKDEVPPWDLLYREVNSRHSSRARFIGEGRRI